MHDADALPHWMGVFSVCSLLGPSQCAGVAYRVRATTAASTRDRRGVARRLTPRPHLILRPPLGAKKAIVEYQASRLEER